MGDVPLRFQGRGLSPSSSPSQATPLFPYIKHKPASTLSIAPYFVIKEGTKHVRWVECIVQSSMKSLLCLRSFILFFRLDSI